MTRRDYYMFRQLLYSVHVNVHIIPDKDPVLTGIKRLAKELGQKKTLKY